MHWQVYMILCTDNTLYTGITTNITRRWTQHAGMRGAKYFRGRKPERIVYLESGHNRSTASQREAAIKRMARSEKEGLLGSPLNEAGRMPALSANPGA
jgi:putative endonuclease